ncbi:MAG: MAPEG family protein, partial [Gammaproteobacteria bacterium]|nr:MAPEG family protein [Gammaproteobacteria bacterium]
SRISLGDGDNKDLRAAIAAHSNASENIPIALLLLVILEYNGGNIWMVHFLGVSLVVGRLLHARGLLTSKFKGRVIGMQITVLMILGVAIANLVYLPYDKLLAL